MYLLIAQRRLRWADTTARSFGVRARFSESHTNDHSGSVSGRFIKSRCSGTLYVSPLRSVSTGRWVFGKRTASMSCNAGNYDDEDS